MEQKQIIVIAVVALVAIGAIAGVAIVLSNGGDSETSYTVKFNVNGGDAIDDKSFTKNTDTFSLPDATRSGGYTFLGWYGNPGFTGDRITQVEKGTEKDIEVWAKWQLDISGQAPSADQIKDNTNVNVSYSDTATAEQMTIPKEAIAEIKSGKEVTVVEKDATGKETMSWTFAGADAPAAGYANDNVTTKVTPDTSKLADEKKITLDFSYSGTLPYASTIRYYVGGSFTEGTLISVQHENGDDLGQYPVDSQGYIEFTITHCSDWYLQQWVVVTFDAKEGKFADGTNMKEVGGVYGSAVVAPDDPVRDGYTFKQWDVVPATFTQAVTATATWTPITYTLNFDKNAAGATGTMDSIQVTFEAPAVIPECTYQYTGHTIVGWTLKDATEPIFVAGNTIRGEDVISYADQSNNVNLYANWSANKYVLTFNGNGGTPAQTTKEVVYGEEYGQLPTADRNGYQFVSWNDNEAGTGSTVTADTVCDGTHLTLYAVYNAISYNITYVLDGGANNPQNPAQYTIEDTVTLLAANKPGSAFNGWFDNAQGTGTEITQISGGTGDKTLYAVWGAFNITVTFNKDGNVWDFDDTVTVVRDASPGTMVKKSAGIYSIESGDNYTITNGEYTIKKGSAVVGAVTVSDGRGTATVDYYTVTFMGETGTALDAKTVLRGDTVEAIDGPAKTGYDFDGWYVGPSGQEKFNFSTPVEGTLILIPKYTPATYAVTFDSDGGSAVSQITATYNALLPDITAPTRDGFDFAGFYLGDVQYIDKDGKGVRIWDQTENKQLKAHWDVKKYDAVMALGDSFVEDVGQGWQATVGGYTKKFEFGTTVQSIIADFAATPQKDYYRMTGWSPDTGTIGIDGVTISPTFVLEDYTFAFNVNGGSGSVASVQEVSLGDSVPQPPYTGTRAWFDNAGSWCYDADGIENVPFSEGTLAVDGRVLSHASEDNVVTLYAKWAPITYTVVFSANGGTGDLPESQTNKTQGDTVTLRVPSVTKQDKFFGGWNTKSDGSGSNYKGSATVDDSFVQYADGTTVTLYINWVDSLYTAAVGDVFSGNKYLFDAKGQTLASEEWKAVVIWADAVSFTIERLNKQGGDWFSDGIVTLTQGRYPSLAMELDDETVEHIRAQGTRTSDTVSVSFNGTPRNVDLDVYSLDMQTMTMVMAEDADQTCYYLDFIQGGGGAEYSHERMTLEAVTEGGYTPVNVSVSYLSARYAENPTQASSIYYKNPADIGMQTPDGKVFVGWMLDGNVFTPGDEDELFTPAMVIASARTVYAVWADRVITPTNIDWEVHNLPAGITMTIDGEDAYESDGTSGHYVTFTGGTGWSKTQVDTGQYRYTFTLDGKEYYLMMIHANNMMVSESPDGDRMRILFEDRDSGQYWIKLYFWMDMPVMKGYLPRIGDQFVYTYSAMGYDNQLTFRVSDVGPGTYYSLETGGGFEDYMYPVDRDLFVDYLYLHGAEPQLQGAREYVWSTGNTVFGGNDVPCYIIQDHMYQRITSEGVAQERDMMVDQAYYGTGDGLMYWHFSSGYASYTTVLNEKPRDMQVVTKYDMVLDANGGTFGGGADTLDLGIVYDLQYRGAYRTPSHDGMELANWNTRADGTGRTYTDCTVINPEDLSEGTITLYAQWSFDGITVAISGEGGTPSSASMLVPFDSFDNTYKRYLYFYDLTGIAPPQDRAASKMTVESLEDRFEFVILHEARYSVVDNGDGTYSYDQDGKTYYRFGEKQIYYYITDMSWASMPDQIDILVTEGVTLDVSLVWTDNIFTITYHSDLQPDETVSIRYAYGTTGVYAGYAPAADTFSRQGFVLSGWYPTGQPELCVSPGDGIGSIEYSMSADWHAKWDATMTVRYNANGGTGTIADQQFHLGDNTVNNGRNLTRDGYSFVGWATSQNSTELAFEGGSTYRMLDGDAGSTMDLYALWATGTYSLAFDMNAPEGDMADIGGDMDRQTIGVGITVHIRSCAFEDYNENYAFAGWNTQADGQGTPYSNGATVRDLAQAGSVVTLYAMWEFGGTTGRLYANFDGANPLYYENPLGDTVELPSAEDISHMWTYDGHVPAYFCTLANGLGDRYDLGETVEGSVFEELQDPYLYVIWQADGGEGYITVSIWNNLEEPECHEEDVYEGDSIRLPSLDDIDELWQYDGHVAVGLNSQADGNGASFEFEGRISYDQAAALDEPNIYVIWAEGEYLRGCLYANFDEADPEFVSHILGSGEMVLPDAQTLAEMWDRDGFVPTGFNTQADGNGDPYDLGGTVTRDEMAALEHPYLYVIWEEGNAPSQYAVYYLDMETENELKSDSLLDSEETYTAVEANVIGYDADGYYLYVIDDQANILSFDFGDEVAVADLIPYAQDGVIIIVVAPNQ